MATAKNWTVAEVVTDVVENGINGNVLDYGKRFQAGTAVIQALVSNVKDKDVLITFVEGLPDNLTMRKLNDGLKAGFGEIDEVEEDTDIDDEVEEAPVKKTAGRKPGVKKVPAKTAVKKVESEGEFSGMDNDTWQNWDVNRKYTKEELEQGTARPLYNIGRKCYDIPHKELTNKTATIECILKAQTVAKGAKPAAKKTPTKQTTTKTTTKSKYAGAKAQQLYAECMKRKIKVPKQKPADFYIAKLEEYDKKNALPENPTEMSYDELQKFTEIQLYKACVKEGIEVEKQMTKEYYISNLIPTEEEEELDFDDWGNEEEDTVVDDWSV